jgi:hypothetical protein
MTGTLTSFVLEAAEDALLDTTRDAAEVAHEEVRKRIPRKSRSTLDSLGWGQGKERTHDDPAAAAIGLQVGDKLTMYVSLRVNLLEGGRRVAKDGRVIGSRQAPHGILGPASLATDRRLE